MIEEIKVKAVNILFNCKAIFVIVAKKAASAEKRHTELKNRCSRLYSVRRPKRISTKLCG